MVEEFYPTATVRTANLNRQAALAVAVVTVPHGEYGRVEMQLVVGVRMENRLEIRPGPAFDRVPVMSLGQGDQKVMVPPTQLVSHRFTETSAQVN